MNRSNFKFKYVHRTKPVIVINVQKRLYFEIREMKSFKMLQKDINGSKKMVFMTS